MGFNHIIIFVGLNFIYCMQANALIHPRSNIITKPKNCNKFRAFETRNAPENFASNDIDRKISSPALVGLAFFSPFLLASSPALADTGVYGSAIPSAFAAYGHYLGLVLGAASLSAERLLIKPNMSVDEEKKLAIADIIWGLAGVLILASGYFRATQFGKGWDFYSHEPIFWFKMVLFMVLGASSLFPTIKIIQRSLDQKQYEDGNKSSGPEPMSEKLATRMIKVVNGELLALLSIPLAASLMSRGIAYADWFPWQAGAGVTAVTALGLSYKYVKEAITWTEE